MSGDGCDKENSTRRVGGDHYFGDGLRAEERASGVDVECSAPFFARHVDGVSTAHDACKTAEDIYASQLLHRRRHSLLHLLRVDDVDLLRYDLRIGKIFVEILDLGRRMRRVKIEECEAG